MCKQSKKYILQYRSGREEQYSTTAVRSSRNQTNPVFLSDSLDLNSKIWVTLGISVILYPLKLHKFCAEIWTVWLKFGQSSRTLIALDIFNIRATSDITVLIQTPTLSYFRESEFIASPLWRLLRFSIKPQRKNKISTNRGALRSDIWHFFIRIGRPCDGGRKILQTYSFHRFILYLPFEFLDFCFFFLFLLWMSFFVLQGFPIVPNRVFLQKKKKKFSVIMCVARWLFDRKIWWKSVVFYFLYPNLSLIIIILFIKYNLE